MAHIIDGSKDLQKLLYAHTPYPHEATNVNDLHRQHKESGGFNRKVAIGMTRLFQSMWTFWAIVFWIVLWIIESFTVPTFADKIPWPMLLALASVPQLPLMIVIMVGQGLLGKHQELQADEQYQFTVKSYHDVEQIMQHLDAQDEKILVILEKLDQA